MTIFSQDTLQCEHEAEAYPCELAESIFDLANSKFGTSAEVAIFDKPVGKFRKNIQPVLDVEITPRNEIIQVIDNQNEQIFENGIIQDSEISDDGAGLDEFKEGNLGENLDVFPNVAALEVEERGASSVIDGEPSSENQAKEIDGASKVEQLVEAEEHQDDGTDNS
jgi:hypothetical protein